MASHPRTPPAGARRTFLTTLAALCAAPSQAATRARHELLLAQDGSLDVDPGPYLVSEKLDGVRAVWDGRALRFRSGRAVSAPAWFTERLPHRALDGELWMGRGRFEALVSTVRRERPDDSAWRAVSYQLFELPHAPGSFAERAEALRGLAAEAAWPALVAVPQQRVGTRAALAAALQAVTAAGGEGLMLHRADAAYRTGRSEVLLKLKPESDDEATVIGHVEGQGRLAGKVGALQVRRDDGTVFLVGSGLADAEREAPPAPGTRITFRYRGLTDRGVPRFATFLRIAHEF